MTAKIITVAQQKGGAGKTTLAAHLAVAYTAMNKRVVAVDIDPQQSLSRWYGLRLDRMDGTPAGVLVSATEGWRARAEVDRAAAGHDLVIIDSPPHAETEARIAIRAADLVVVPVQPSPMDVWATRPTLELAAAEKVPALLVFNRVQAVGEAQPSGRAAQEIAALAKEILKAAN
jgi:chromosome partitioning protein